MKLATWILRGSITLFFFVIYFSYLHYINHGYLLNDDEGLYLLSSVNSQDASPSNSFFYIYFHILSLFTHNIVFFRLFSMFLFVSSAFLLAFVCARFFPIVRKQSLFYTLLMSMLICVSLNFIDFPMIPNYNIFNIVGCVVVYSLILFCLEARLSKRSQLAMYFLVGFFVGFVFLNKFPTGIMLLAISLAACFFDKKEYSRTYNAFYIFVGIAAQLALFFMFLHPFSNTVQEAKYATLSPASTQSHSILLIIAQSFIQTLASVFFSMQKFWIIYLALLTVFFFQKKWKRFLVDKIVIFSLITYFILALINLHEYFLTPWLFGRLNHEFYYSAALVIILTYLIYNNDVKKYSDVFSTSREIFLIAFLFFLPFIQALGTNCLFPDCVVNGFFMWIPLICYLTSTLSPVLSKLFTTACLFAISLVTMSIIVINLHQKFSSMNEKINIRGAHLITGKDTKYIIEETRHALSACGFQAGDFLIGNPSMAMIYAVSGRKKNQINVNQSLRSIPAPYEVWYDLKNIQQKIYFVSATHSLLWHIENTLRNISTQHEYQSTIPKDREKMESQPHYLQDYALCANLKIHAQTSVIQYDGIKVYKIKNI